MISASLQNNSGAKAKFFLVYAISVALFVVIVLSIFKRVEPGSETSTVSTENKNEQNSFTDETNSLLRTKMEVLGKAYLTTINSNDRTGIKPPSVETAENDLQNTLTDVKQKAEAQEDARVKEATKQLLAFFEADFNNQRNLYGSLLQSKKANQQVPLKSNDAELQNLNAMVEQKNKQIAALEQSLREKPTVVQQPGSNEASQWKEKAAALKAANDKLVNQVNTITKSYQVIVEDNRRLLSRLKEVKQ